MAFTSNDIEVKSEQPDVKIEPDLSPMATRKKRKTQNRTEQQSIAKRRIIEWSSDAAKFSPEIQHLDDELEQMSQSLSRVGMDNAEDQDLADPSLSSSPVMASLAVGSVPFIPEIASDRQHQTTPCEETLFSSQEAQDQRLAAPASPVATARDVPGSDEEQEPKVRRITDFFSKGRFDPNKFFTPPRAPAPKVKTDPNVGLSNSTSLPKRSSKPKATAVRKKKSTPETVAAVATTTITQPTSRRLIKLDPEEISDNGKFSKGDGSSSKPTIGSDDTITIDDDDKDNEKRFVRSSPPAAPETSMSISQIKALLERIKQGAEPDIFDPKYRCQACPRAFDRQKTFHNHMHSKHGVNLEERRFIVLTYGPKPNIIDESMFCKQCQKQYVSKDRFQHHNELHHGFEKVKLSRVAHKRRKGHDMSEVQDDDDDDMNDEDKEREVEAQEKMDTLEQNEKKNKQATLKDLENHRNLGYCQAAILNHRGPPPDVNDPNFYCNVCTISYSNRGSYHFHLRAVHKMDFAFAASTASVRKKYKGPPPDSHHPKNYCCVCDIYYSQKLVYTYHLRNVHNIDIPFDKSPGIRIAVDDIKDESRKPDKTDPDYFCAYCNRGYTQRSSYLIHLNKMHFIDIPQRRPGALRPRPPLEPGVSPDVLDPNNYCCVCDVKFAHANSYRIHIKKYHGLGDALEAITCNRKGKRSRYYLDRRITNAGYHEERARSSQKTLDFFSKPSGSQL
ncbi:hypothetical protein MAM1_0012d01231 [Mucor ambiguus]|uniref:C2H2-type domain-containing protein n=1 Tax=Mucor ambiguus TaxID=91626 RepID=A0A0C9M0U8_9FUNG|nr:hypothetical protein MAM1_0012d01231 [Mucor ambiguus]